MNDVMVNIDFPLFIIFEFYLIVFVGELNYTYFDDSIHRTYCDFFFKLRKSTYEQKLLFLSPYRQMMRHFICNCELWNDSRNVYLNYEYQAGITGKLRPAVLVRGPYLFRKVNSRVLLWNISPICLSNFK